VHDERTARRVAMAGAAVRFACELGPCVDYAKAAGVTLAPEPTSHLYADVSIAHRLADVVLPSRAAGNRCGDRPISVLVGLLHRGCDRRGRIALRVGTSE
jgi:hypothetical protein